MSVPERRHPAAPDAAAWALPYELDSASRDRQSVNGLFRVFLPLRETRWLLTDANGVGATALSLAALADRVVCLCPNVATASRIRFRARRDAIPNVHPVVASLAALPCRPTCIDHISLHRVEHFETASRTWREISGAAAELARVLADGGSLFVSFERRRVPPGPLRRTPPRLRATVRELRRRLRIRASIFHFPSLDDASLVQYVAHRRRRLADRWLAFRRWITGTNVGLVLVKSPADPEPPHVLEQIRARVADLGRGVPTAPRSVFFGTGGSLVADLGTVVVRLPQHEAAAGRCAANLAALRKLAESADLALAPHPLGEGALRGQRFFVESRLDGVSMDEESVRPTVRAAIRDQAIELLMSKPDMYVGPTDPRAIEALVEQEFAGLTPFVALAERAVLDRMAERMCGILADAQVPMVIHHGDFKCSNFRYDTSPRVRLTGIVDWDLASIPGLPVLDLLTIHFDAPDTPFATLPRLFYGLAHTANIPAIVRRYATSWDLSMPVVHQLALLATAKHLNRHFHFALRMRPIWQELLRTTLLARG
jgi:Phosphotransferase enzyme family/Methyltransferase domain